MEKPKLILHIGAPKTGSKTIQSSLLLNKGYLKDKGVYFENNYSFSADLFLRNSCYPFKKTDIRYNGFLPAEAAVASYMDRFLSSGCKKALISSEGMFALYSDNKCNDNLIRDIKNTFKEFDISIICYLRRQDYYLESLYNHIVKGREALSETRVRPLKTAGWFTGNKPLSHFERFINDSFHMSEYSKVISGWAEIFGKENIIIRPFEKCQLKNGLIHDFYSNALNVTDDVIQKLKPVASINESMSRDIIEFKLKSGIDDLYIFACLNKLIDNKTNIQGLFTNTERRRFLNFHEEGNAFLAREYLGREDEKLFYDEIEEYEPYPGLSLERAKEIGNKMMALISYKRPYETFEISRKVITVEEVIETVRKVYFENVVEQYIKDKLENLFNLLNGSGKTVVIYGAFGKLAERTFEAADSYKKCVSIYVSDKTLNGEISYKGYGVASLNAIKALNPDIILIAAKFSGEAIKKDLEKLNLQNTIVCPVYDLSDKIWEHLLPSFLSNAQLPVC